MAVYLPSAAIGNGRILCTLGPAGEVMSLFYPRVDFAQSVRQLLPALYVGDPGHGRFLWTFDTEWERHQEYEPRTNVLTTTLHLPAEEVTVTLTDFCPPDSAALVRRVAIRPTGDRPFRGAFMEYFELRINEITGKQSVRHIPEDGLVLQYCRDIAIAVGGDPATVWRCGKSIDKGPRSAKSDMYDGHLNGQPEDIGQVDFALGWQMAVARGGTHELDIIIAPGGSRDEACQHARTLTRAGGAALQSQATEDDRAWLGRLRQPTVPDWIADAYRRALLSLRMLQDAGTGAITAAPEFDPSYELCGGYGYCWPRDATEAADALALAGDASALASLTGWYLGTQLPSGQWGQRYWSDGMMASSWALREDFLQVDQTAAAVIALCRAAGPVGTRLVASGRPEVEDEPAACRGSGRDRSRPYEVWPSILRAATSLAAMVGDDGWHAPACDLWETSCGTFVYTNAAIYAALRDAAAVARQLGEADLAADWEAACARMKAATIALHNGEHFPRGLIGEGHPDMVMDSSTLGISEPFRMISPEVPQERALIEANLLTIEQRLNYRMADGGVGIRRYEGDGYLGGVIGCVNTLWFALVCLQVGNSYRGEDEARATEWREKAEGYIRFALDHGTATGLLPELIGIYPEYPYWAVPHAWASGLMVKCALEMDRLSG